MANTYKVLGQSNPAATTLTTLYTVPAATSTVVSTIFVCNQGSAADVFRIAIRPAGASIVASQYIYYGTPIAANDTFAATVGITLATTDVVSIYSGTTNLSFSLLGCEVT